MYMDDAVNQLCATGREINDDDLARLSPLQHEQSRCSAPSTSRSPTNSPPANAAHYEPATTDGLRPYGLGHPLQGLPAGLRGRTPRAGVCLAGDRLRLTPRMSEEVRPCPER